MLNSKCLLRASGGYYRPDLLDSSLTIYRFDVDVTQMKQGSTDEPSSYSFTITAPNRASAEEFAFIYTQNVVGEWHACSDAYAVDTIAEEHFTWYNIREIVDCVPL